MKQNFNFRIFLIFSLRLKGTAPLVTPIEWKHNKQNKQTTKIKHQRKRTNKTKKKTTTNKTNKKQKENTKEKQINCVYLSVDQKLKARFFFFLLISYTNENSWFPQQIMMQNFIYGYIVLGR